MKKALSLALLLAVSAVPGSIAAETNYLKAYDAVYEMTSPYLGKSQMHQMSDGKGHFRTESDIKGNKTITILDFAGKQAITIMDAGKMYIKSPITPEQETSVDWSKPKSNQKSLGTKVISSHPCHGYETRQGDVVSQVWIGDDIQNLVRSETTTKQGKTIMDLKTYSSKAPNTNLMAIPAGYKPMNVGGR